MKKDFKCPVCDNANCQTIFINPKNIGLSKCNNCDLLFTYPKPTDEQISKFYATDNYFKNWFLYKNIKFQTEQLRINSIIKKIQNYQIDIDLAKAKLLDFGCGPGFFIETATRYNIDCFGIEFSDFAVDYCQRANLKVTKIQNLPLDFDAEFFDIITIWHTLEHLTNPKETLLECQRLLKKNGILVIEVPNVHGLLQLLRGYKSLPLIEHQLHFSAKTLRYLLELTGFEIIELLPGAPGYTRAGLKVLIKKIFANIGKFLYYSFNFYYCDTLLVYCRKNKKN